MFSSAPQIWACAVMTVGLSLPLCRCTCYFVLNFCVYSLISIRACSVPRVNLVSPGSELMNYILICVVSGSVDEFRKCLRGGLQLFLPSGHTWAIWWALTSEMPHSTMSVHIFSMAGPLTPAEPTCTPAMLQNGENGMRDEGKDEMAKGREWRRRGKMGGGEKRNGRRGKGREFGRRHRWMGTIS